MFFASVGEETDVDLFAFYLADRLKKTLHEIEQMPHAEYVAWSSFHKVKQQQEQLAMKVASHGR